MYECTLQINTRSHGHRDVKYDHKRTAGSLGFSSNSTLHSKLLSPGVFSLENLCPDSAARMHPPRPHYLDTHPCTIPPSNMRENPAHSRTVVKRHLLPARVPQREDWLSGPRIFPCRRPLPMTGTHGEAAEVGVPPCTTPQQSCCSGPSHAIQPLSRNLRPPREASLPFLSPTSCQLVSRDGC